MELVLMLPEKKPPFIGVLFYAADGEPGIVNSDLIYEHKKKRYEIILETFRHHVNLRLVCPEIVNVRFYNHIKYDAEKLKSWLYIISAHENPVVNFSQLTIKDGKIKVATTSPRTIPFVLKVVKCELFVPKSLGDKKVAITTFSRNSEF